MGVSLAVVCDGMQVSGAGVSTGDNCNGSLLCATTAHHCQSKHPAAEHLAVLVGDRCASTLRRVLPQLVSVSILRMLLSHVGSTKVHHHNCCQACQSSSNMHVVLRFAQVCRWCSECATAMQQILARLTGCKETRQWLAPYKTLACSEADRQVYVQSAC